MGRILVYPYKMYSSSAKKLSSALNCKRIRDVSRYRSRWTDLVVNWGNSTIPVWYSRILNSPEKVANATNKLTTFKILSEHEVSTPEFTEDKSVAEQWVGEGSQVYCRQLLSSHSGMGIVIANSYGELCDCKLYTKRVKAKYEFRVHVFNGSLLDFQLKKRKLGSTHNPAIRNYRNGYIYARSAVRLPRIVEQQAIKAVTALGLDFGAVDIGYVEREDKAYVFEVNTAPGLVGTTLDLYVNKFKEIANEL